VGQQFPNCPHVGIWQLYTLYSNVFVGIQADFFCDYISMCASYLKFSLKNWEYDFFVDFLINSAIS